MKVVWTEPAVLRLEDIRSYLRDQAGEEVADQVLEAIVARGESLAQFPERGRRLPERPRAALRELVEAGRYRLVYRTRAEQVEILTVFERHRLLPVGDLVDDERANLERAAHADPEDADD